MNILFILILPELNIILESEELKDRVDNGDDKGEDQQVDICLQKCLEFILEGEFLNNNK